LRLFPRRFSRLLAALATVLALTVSLRAADFAAADFDARPGTKEDCTQAARAALRALMAAPDGGTLVFAPGEYHFYPEHARPLVRYVSNHDNSRAPRRFVFDLCGAKAVTIAGAGGSAASATGTDAGTAIGAGAGTRFVFHGNVTPFLVENSAAVRVRDLVIDWSPPLLYEGEVLAADARGFEVRVPADEPFEVDAGAFVIRADGERLPMDSWCEFAADGSGQAAGSGDTYGFRYHATQTGARTVRFDVAGGGALRRPPAVGNIVFLRCNLRAAPAFFLEKSKNVSLEAVTVHHAPGMGLLAQRCEDVTLRRFSVVPNATAGRQVSTHYDATHFTGCRGRVLIEDGEFRNMLDDAMNVHGVYLQVLRRMDDRRLLAWMAHFQAQGFTVVEPGDRVRLVRQGTLMPAAESVVTRVERRGPDGLLLAFDGPLAEKAEPLDALENISWTADVVFRRNRVSGNRARSILVSTQGRVVIEDNVFNATGSAIRVSGDARSWFESGPVADVLIRRNVFTNPLRCAYGRAAIDLDPEVGTPTPPGAGFYHRNIRILENRFRLCDTGVLLARSVHGLEFSGNTVEYADDFPALNRQATAFELVHCRDARLERNRIGGRAGAAVLAADPASAASAHVAPGQNIIMRGGD
jgi:hypothetical protein